MRNDILGPKGPKATLPELKSFLEKHEIPYGSWKSPETKTVGDLLEQIRTGTAGFVVRNGTLVRIVRSLMMDVCNIYSPHTILTLRENDHRSGKKFPGRTTAHSASMKMPLDHSGGTKSAAVACIQNKLPFLKRFIGKNLVWTDVVTGKSPIESVEVFLHSNQRYADFCVLADVCDFYPLDEKDTPTFPGLQTMRDHSIVLCVIPESAMILPRQASRRSVGSVRLDWVPISVESYHYLTVASESEDD